MVMINIMLFLAVLVTSWCATQQAVDDHRDDFANVTTPKEFPVNLNRATASGVDGHDDNVVKEVQPRRVGKESGTSFE